jgi:uncharacterized membrane protein YozB (DUF420 family)
MNIKLKAAIETVLYLFAIIAIAGILQLIGQQFTVEEIKTAISTAGILFCVYLIYTLRLSSLQSQKTLEKLNETR